MALTEGTKESIYIGLLVEHLMEGVEGEVGTYPIDALCDSQAAICISNMNSLLRKVRHLELRAQHIQEQVSSGRLKPSYLPGKENPADGLTKSPTEEMLWSLCEATGLVEYPGMERDSARRVDFGIEEIYEIHVFDPCRLKVPDEWMDAAMKVASGKVDLIVLELYCLARSAICIACEKGHRVAYFGVTKSVDFLIYNCLGCLLELLKCLGEGSTVKVWCHISTPCTAGCGLCHLHMKNESFLPKWRENIAQHIRGWNRISRLFARRCQPFAKYLRAIARCQARPEFLLMSAFAVDSGMAAHDSSADAVASLKDASPLQLRSSCAVDCFVLARRRGGRRGA